MTRFGTQMLRVKTSVLVLKPKRSGEKQGEAFMDAAVYVGLNEKFIKRLGIGKDELIEGRQSEICRIVEAYRAFESGTSTSGIVSPDRLRDRLDVKHCVDDRGRKRAIWIHEGSKVALLGDVLRLADGRKLAVQNDASYRLLKVTYGGDVLEGEILEGAETSYGFLYQVKAWDVVYSDMGVGRGAIGIVPESLDGCFVSNEYTILNVQSAEEALYYTTVIRSKEILGDILTTTTGMNRGRVDWDLASVIEVPTYDANLKDFSQLTQHLNELWNA